MSEEVKQEGEFKVKKKPGRPKKLTKTKSETTIKVDLAEKPTQDAIPEPETERVVLPPDGEKKETGEESNVELPPVGETHTEEQTSSAESEKEKVIEEIIENKEPVEKEDSPAPVEPVAQLPENIDSLVKFMKETGGSVEDYVNLNKDYTTLKDNVVLREYYNKTKPHLDPEEIEFILDDKFTWNNDEESERDIKKKKLAYKEEIAKARTYLEESKSDYYKEIKLNSNITPEHQAAMDFWNAYKQNQQEQTDKHKHFKSDTVKFFKGDFEGFNFDVGDKTFRYKLHNPNETADRQSDLRSIFKKFLNDKGEVIDYSGYHKAIYAANNTDTLAKHFYEQGKADATKDIIAKSKNIQDGKPRATAGGDVFINGLKVRAITGADGSKLKIKKRT